MANMLKNLCHSRVVKILASILCFIAFGFWFVFRPNLGVSTSIPQGWGSQWVVRFKGAAAQPHPLTATTPNFQHPFLAGTNSNNMHVDAYASDVHALGGPLGKDVRVRTYAHGVIGGECATVTFDSRGNIVTVCATFGSFALLLMSPDDLRPLARFELPGRASTRTFSLRKIMTDTSGGAYFFLDNQDRAVLVDAQQRLLVIRQDWTTGTPAFAVDLEIQLKPILEEHTSAEDAVTAILPDTTGRYWFVSRLGLVGIVEPKSGKISALRLQGEEIQNSFALDERAVYVVSDYALYAVSSDPVSGAPVIKWREPYERSTQRKPGMIGLGSGTTPTLVEDYVVIADNAEPRTNVLVYRRNIDFTGERLVCKFPVFEPGRSATENSIIAYGRSLIVENNYGYDLFPTMMFGRTSAGGLVRVDIDANERGCTQIWASPIKSQTTVPKLSLQTGLVYAYAKDPAAGKGIDAYYLVGIEFATGNTVFEALTGTGVAYDNNWAPITLAPNACAYIGSLRGLIQVCDVGE